VLKGSEYMNAVLYTGNGSNRSITGVGFQPDFVWIKKRSGAESHVLSDAIRGTNNFLSSNSTASENTASGTLTAFNSDGFSLGTQGIVNDNTFTFVSWNWKANGAGVTNTAGTITSTVSANTTSGFSIVTWTGNGSAGTIGHGLGVAPSMIIWKNRSAIGSWIVGHSSLTSWSYYLPLQATSAQTLDTSTFNGTAPTSSVWSIGAYNTNANNFVAYCFAPISGFSAFGSYTGNGSTDGPFVYLGFRPRYVMIKRIDTAGGNWIVLDSVRDTYNVEKNILYPNLSNAEGVADYLDFLSNGFKLRTTDGNGNASGLGFIYAAFAENPFKNALAR